MRHRNAAKDPRKGVQKTKQPENTPEEQRFANNLNALGFLNSRPYKLRTSFGYVTLLDPRREIKNAVFKEEKGILHMGLDDGETLALQFLRKGCYYATTGVSCINHISALTRIFLFSSWKDFFPCSNFAFTIINFLSCKLGYFSLFGLFIAKNVTSSCTMPFI